MREGIQNVKIPNKVNAFLNQPQDLWWRSPSWLAVRISWARSDVSTVSIANRVVLMLTVKLICLPTGSDAFVNMYTSATKYHMTCWPHGDYIDGHVMPRQQQNATPKPTKYAQISGASPVSTSPCVIYFNCKILLPEKSWHCQTAWMYIA